MSTTPVAATPSASISLEKFLEDTPPYVYQDVHDVWGFQSSHAAYYRKCALTLHCQTCRGPRFFDFQDTVYFSGYDILKLKCRHCLEQSKIFAVIGTELNDGKASMMKLGEYPKFGPPIPDRVLKLVGSDRQKFIQGFRAELQGFGIGAYAYYRQIVEDQKVRLIDSLRKAAEKLGASNEELQAFDGLENVDFGTCAERLTNMLPRSLRIDGHNPLKLLHKALSKNIHEGDDAECHKHAIAIRTILVEMAERIAEAVRERREVSKAVGHLTQI